MPFAAIGTALGASAATATMTGVAATVGAAGLGMSAASAAGAFNGPVDKWTPTPQEMEAAKWSKNVFGLGQSLQAPLDAAAKKSLSQLGSNTGLGMSADAAVNSTWANGGDVMGAPSVVAARSGGPGSGQFWGQLWEDKANLNRGLYGADVSGRMAGLNQYLTSTNQYLGRKAGTLGSGLNAMTTGGQQAAQAQADRINAQIAQNVATTSAMSGLGNTMMGVGMGMGGLSATKK